MVCAVVQDIHWQCIAEVYGLEGGAGGGVKESPKD